MELRKWAQGHTTTKQQTQKYPRLQPWTHVPDLVAVVALLQAVQNESRGHQDHERRQAPVLSLPCNCPSWKPSMRRERMRRRSKVGSIRDQIEILKLTAIRSLGLWAQVTDRDDVSSFLKRVEARNDCLNENGRFLYQQFITRSLDCMCPLISPSPDPHYKCHLTSAPTIPS